MKLNHTKTEKENIILQLKEDLARLGVTEVGLPEEASEYTIGSVSAIQGVEDTGDDSKVIPNTTVTISFKDTAKPEKTHTTSFNYKRLDVALLKEKRSVENMPSKNYVFESHAHEENGKPLDANTLAASLTAKLREKLELPADTAATPKLKTNGNTDILAGVTEVEWDAADNSLTTKGKVSLSVETRSPSMGEIKFKDRQGNIKSYFFKAEGMLRQEIKAYDAWNAVENMGSDNIMVLPKNMTAIPATFLLTAHGPQFNLHPVPPENLTTISPGAFADRSRVQLLDVSSLDYNAASRYDIPKQEIPFFKNISVIGDGSLKGLTVYSGEDQPLVFGTENLEIGEDALGNGVNLQYAKVASLKAIPQIIRQAARFDKLEYTKTHEAGKAAVESEDYSTYGYLKYGKGDNETTIYITADDLNSALVSPATSEKSANPYLKEYKLPDTVSEYPANFLRKAKLNTLTVQVGETYKTDSFADATIENLVVDIEDTNIESLFEVGAFKNATINNIEVKNAKTKAKLVERINALANEPTWKIKEATTESSPVVEGEVPAEVVSSGLNYDEV